MNLNPRKYRALSVAAVALLSVTSLAACGSSDDKASSDQSTSATATTSASAEASNAQSDEAKDNAAAEAPAGYQTVTASANKISFAVPESWINFDLSEADIEAVYTKEQLQEIADNTGMSIEQIKQAAAELDVHVIDPATNDNVNVSKTPVASSELPAEEEMISVVQSINGTPGKYKTVDTANGKGAEMTYTLTGSQGTAYGEYVIAPSGVDGTYSVITVTASSAENAQKYADTIAETLKKAS